MRRIFLTIGAGVALSMSAIGLAHAKSDKAFLGDAIKGDTSEVTLGQLAAEKGGSEGVRAFGRMLERDHAHAKVQAIMAARREGVTPPSGMKPEAREEMHKLKRLSGDRFDREFARYMVKDHRKDVAEFEKQAATNQPTAQLAKKTVPTLKKHLAAARKLAGS